MVDFLYEKDLRRMQYNILVSTRHDMVITEIARRYGLSKQEVRRTVIRRLDMILLENMPARWEAGATNDAGDPLRQALGAGLITRAVPLVDGGAMDEVLEEVTSAIAHGTPEETAMEQGIARIRELIRP